MQHLYGLRGEAHVHFLTYQRVGDAVEVAVDLDVVVDVDAGLLPLGVFEGRRGQRLQGGPLQGLALFPNSSRQIHCSLEGGQGGRISQSSKREAVVHGCGCVRVRAIGERGEQAASTPPPAHATDKSRPHWRRDRF